MGTSVTLHSFNFFLFLFFLSSFFFSFSLSLSLSLSLFQFNSRILYNGRSGWYRLSGTSFSHDDKCEVREQGRAMDVLDRLPLYLLDSPLYRVIIK